MSKQAQMVERPSQEVTVATPMSIIGRMVESGAELLFVPNGSPYYRGKFDRRINHMVARVIENDVPLIYLNMVGGQDDQVFDGGSFVLNRGGRLALQLPLFDEAIAHVDFNRAADGGWEAQDGQKIAHVDEWEQDYRVMVQGLRDYVHKNRFPGVVLGLSGGIDSALVAAIAADALGADLTSKSSSSRNEVRYSMMSGSSSTMRILLPGVIRSYLLLVTPPPPARCWGAPRAGAGQGNVCRARARILPGWCRRACRQSCWR